MQHPYSFIIIPSILIRRRTISPSLISFSQMDRAGVEVLFRPKQGMPGPMEREAEQLIKGVSSTYLHHPSR